MFITKCRQNSKQIYLGTMNSIVIGQLLKLTILLALLIPKKCSDYQYDDTYDDYPTNEEIDLLFGSRGPTLRNNRPHPSDAILTRQTKNKEDKLMNDLLDGTLSTDEVDLRVPALKPANRGGVVRLRNSGACPDSRCFQCLDSCRHLKRAKVAANALSQYTYLRLCSMGCKEELDCLSDNYCLPVMKENPDYFVQCSGNCNLFQIVPKIFKTGQYC